MFLLLFLKQFSVLGTKRVSNESFGTIVAAAVALRFVYCATASERAFVAQDEAKRVLDCASLQSRAPTVRLAERSKAPDLSSGTRKCAWVRTPHLTSYNIFDDFHALLVLCDGFA